MKKLTENLTSKDRLTDARERKFAEAEKLAGKLAKAGRDFAERNYERVIDYGGYSVLVILGTTLFTSMFGLSAEEALAAHSSCSLAYLEQRNSQNSDSCVSLGR